MFDEEWLDSSGANNLLHILKTKNKSFTLESEEELSALMF